MSHYQPPLHLSKRELEEEFLKLMDTYGKRLLVIERILVATREPTELVKQITNIRLENLAAKRRLESNLRVVGGLIPPETDALIDVWCITRMKLYYHKVLKENRILSEIAARWSGNPAILSLMESYNDEVFGRAAEASAKRVNVFTFPVLIKDHLLYLRDYLEQYSQRTRTFAFERILELNSWLGQDRPYLSSIRGLDLGEVFTKFRKRDEVIIEQTNMSIRGHKWELAPCTLYMSESFLVIRIPECWGPNEPIVDYAPLQDCDIEPAHDDYSLEVTGVGTTKILVALNGTTRFQWMVAIRELKELWC